MKRILIIIVAMFVLLMDAHADGTRFCIST